MNWLEIAVIVLIAVMVIVGLKRGFVKMIVGIIAMVCALIGTMLIAPQLANYINENTQLRQSIASKLDSYLEEQVGEKLSQNTKEAQQQAIEKLSLPENVKEAIKKNNTSEIYRKMGVSSFSEYVSDYVARTAVSALSYLVSFLAIYIILRVVFVVLNIVSLLPFLNGVNHLAGGALGAVHALVYIWVFFAVATAAMNTDWGMSIMSMIGQSTFLGILYQYNVILALILSIVT